VGIGTASPSAKLQVQKSGKSFQLYDASTNDGAYMVLAGSSTTKNWCIGNQFNVAGTLEFTQTSAIGGTTIGASPSLAIDTASNVNISIGSLTVGTGTPSWTRYPSTEFSNASAGGTRNVTITCNSSTGEYYAKIILVGLCTYGGGTYFNKIVEVCGFGGIAGAITSISNTGYGAGSPPTVVVTQPTTGTINVAVTFVGNYRTTFHIESLRASNMFITAVSA
jgi:hypothetical protein